MTACTARLRCPLPTLRCPLLTISTHARIIHDDVIKWNHFLRHWPSVRGIHRSPVNSPHKGHRRGALQFSLISAWINGRVNMQGQNNWGNWGSPGVMKLWVAWEVLRWLMKFRELCSGGFHPKLVTSPYHGFLNVNTPPNSQNPKRHWVQRNTQVPVGKHNNRQYASPHHEVATDVKQMPIRPIIIIINNDEAGDLGRHRSHYDVIVM